jgi:hypothetical protein
MVTYAVTVSLTEADGWVTGATGALTLEAGAKVGDPLAPSRREEGLAWILVSHGANGAGATMPSGETLADPFGAREIENLGRAPDGDLATFRRAPHVLDSTAGAPYDDLVRAGRSP